jgi:hypothetical protein
VKSGSLGLAIGANDIDGRPVANWVAAQCAAVKTVRALISEPVQNEPKKAGSVGLRAKRLTVLGNRLALSYRQLDH